MDFAIKHHFSKYNLLYTETTNPERQTLCLAQLLLLLPPPNTLFLFSPQSVLGRGGRSTSSNHHLSMINHKQNYNTNTKAHSINLSLWLIKRIRDIFYFPSLFSTLSSNTLLFFIQQLPIITPSTKCFCIECAERINCAKNSRDVDWMTEWQRIHIPVIVSCLSLLSGHLEVPFPSLVCSMINNEFIDRYRRVATKYCKIDMNKLLEWLANELLQQLCSCVLCPYSNI